MNERRRIPKWLRISVAAVLGLIVLLIAGGLWLRGYVKRMADPEVQWAAIREVIAVDEPLPPYGVAGMPPFWSMQTWSLFDPAGDRFGMLLHDDGGAGARRRRKMFDPETRELPGKSLGPGVPLEHGTILVQGRDLRWIRFTSPEAREGAESGTSRDRSGPTILVELSRQDGEEFLGFIMVAEGEGGRVEDAQIVDFLKPFHVGPDR